MPMLTAGAQSGGGGVPPASPGDCTFTAAGTAPGTVTGAVIVPAGASLVIVTFTPGEGDPTPTCNSSSGAERRRHRRVLVRRRRSPASSTANFLYGSQNAYTTGCTGPGGIQAIAITRSAAGAAAAAQRLAFTGSSDTPIYVLVGIAALVIGAVLVVAARRRSQVS